MATPAAGIQEGEGGSALAFCIAGAFAAALLLPATQLLDLKAAAGALTAALACLGLVGAWARGRAWRPRRALAWSLEAWRWATVALAGYALAQRVGIEPMPAYALAGSHDRAMGSFGNAGYLAAYLCLSWPLLLAWSGARRNAALALAWAALLATQSRAGLLAAAMQGLAWAWSAWRKGWRPGWALSLGAVAALALSAFLMPPSSWLRPTLRLPLWRAAWGLFLQRPWTGWGWGQFAAAFQAHADPAFVAALNAGGQVAEDPHNVLLAVACAGGVMGLLLFGAALWAAARAARASALPGAGLALLGLLVESQADRFFFHAGVLAPLILLLAALRWERPAAWAPRWRAAALAPALLALALLWAGARPILAYRNATGADLGAGAAALDAGGDPVALAAAAQAGRDPRDFDRLGDALAARQRWAEAAAAFRQALSLAPSAGRAQNLGNCAMMLGDAAGAEAAFRRAVALAPGSSDAHFSLGYALYYQKRLQEAVEELDAALRLDPGNASALKLKEQILQ
jgi:tetratricopeptide (TPR) repeat protein